MTAIVDPIDGELRSPETVMTLERLGSAFPTRLSFMRSLMRELAANRVAVFRPVWEIDKRGFGRAVYTLRFGGHDYSLVAFSTELADEDRTDRVIATAWDSSYVLFDGVPTTADLDRLEAAAPRQEAARFDAPDLILSRANRSVRLFDHVIERLAEGRQPDEELLGSVGYLMRTTAVYGNGKFGIADRAGYRERPSMDHPFRAEMLTVWLIRAFTIDLVEHIAFERNPSTAVAIEPRLKRFLGIGNATGLGMAPFLISHPILINNWLLVRETALARVRSVELASVDERARFGELCARVGVHLDQWSVEDAIQMERIATVRTEWSEVCRLVDQRWLSQPQPWRRLLDHAERWGLETQELIAAAVIEPYGHLVDGLTGCMSSPVEPMVDPSGDLTQLREAIASDWRWALDIDFDDPEATAQFWYVSEDKLEPRIGRRHEEPGADLERPLDVARRVAALHAELGSGGPRAGTDRPDSETLAEFLLRCPEHRYAVKRVQTLARHPFAEIRGNLIGAGCRPIDLLRAKLAFFGASKFDPKSDMWTRVTLYQGAPLAEDIAAGMDADDWWLPVLEPS